MMSCLCWEGLQYAVMLMFLTFQKEMTSDGLVLDSDR